MKHPGPPLTCACGHCRKCYLRIIRQKYYERHRADVIQKNVAQRAARKQDLWPEVSDEELDRRALVMMGRIQNAH